MKHLYRRFRAWLRWQLVKRRVRPIRPALYETRNFFHWLRARLEARAWLSRNNPDAIAARCMWALNRHARTGRGYEIIYPLKQVLIRLFHARGLCKAVTIQKQELKCWDCGGTGDDGDCWKCGGTGVYRSTYLYRFAFEISGRRYVWHQPVKLAEWVEFAGVPAAQFGEVGVYEAREGEWLDAPLTWIYTAAVVEYLKLRGVTVEVELPTLRRSLWRDWRATDLSKRLARLRNRAWDLGDDVRRLLEFVRTGRLPPSNRIPF